MSESPTITPEPITLEALTDALIIPLAGLSPGTQVSITVIIGPPVPEPPLPPEPPAPERRYLGGRRS